MKITVKKYILILTGLFIFHSQIISARISFSKTSEATTKFRDSTSAQKYPDPDNIDDALKSKTTDQQITIYYGLNGSNSRSWVRENSSGVVGISCFQRFEGSYDEGTLIYKTIYPDGSMNIDSITTGTRLEKSVLLYDSLSSPHIFVASSDTTDQVINHYSKNNEGQWQNETIIHFYNEGGKFIYELSADKGPDNSFHLLILKTRSDIDSDDFMNAWINSHLYHMTNASGVWVKELIHNYDMAYTYDMYIKTSNRQDIKIDKDGYIHVTFAEQINGNGFPDPSRLQYASNKTGSWAIETALNYDNGTVDDAGWFPSLCLDNNDIPYISCIYVKRVPTYSATSCKLLLLKRLDNNNWNTEIIAEYDDGYYGGDGRDYTGALSHLVFDVENTPHIIFSDIASTHWPVLNQRLNVGNIRYGIFENGSWNITTIYRQPLPTGFFNATEMYGMCLVVSDETNMLHVIGQELVITEENQYSCTLLNFAWEDISNIVDDAFIKKFELNQNYPNPFNPTTTITYSLAENSEVEIKIFNSLGVEVGILLREEKEAGIHSIEFNSDGLPSGIYFYKLISGTYTNTKKMILLK
jgi:hypothetical protein